jgi:hypothetical protein
VEVLTGDELVEATPAEARRQKREPKKKARTEMCIHRVGPDSWCKRCDE